MVPNTLVTHFSIHENGLPFNDANEEVEDDDDGTILSLYAGKAPPPYPPPFRSGCLAGGVERCQRSVDIVSSPGAPHACEEEEEEVMRIDVHGNGEE